MSSKTNYKVQHAILIVITALIFAINIQFNGDFKSMRFELILYNIINMDNLNVGINSFIGPIKDVILSFIIILIACLIPIFIPSFTKKEISIKFMKKKINIFPFSEKIYTITLFLISIISLLSSVNFWGFVSNNISNSTLYEDYYVEYNKNNVTFPSYKSNLITIYVESFENSVFTKNNGGTNNTSYMPQIEAYTNNHINFSNNDQIGGFYQINGADWTASSLVAQTSGVPIYFKTTNKNDIFLEGAISIGEILEDNGYKNYFLMGSDANFGDRKNYFLQHGNYEIFDHTSAIQNNLINSNYFVWWGYEDRKLYTYAKTQLLDIANNNEPFNFSLLTADTHSYDGYTDKECPNQFDSKYANSYYCTDIMLYDFITWIQEQDFYENTVIVIVGDHLTMRDDFFEVDKDYDRTIYNLFINSRISTDNTKNRQFSAFDIYPTTLAALGVNIKGDRLALGTNLFSEEKTLIEELGLNKFEKEISSISKYYNKEILKK